LAAITFPEAARLALATGGELIGGEHRADAAALWFVLQPDLSESWVSGRS
jgi:hypothetical protein